ncbi:hypothetical protein [Crossiella cryophila]|uniref:Uncharacterized protein n=1 Tax=Crossiella cryophila TaxID=43355 RepID=A0A7W7FV99_9PSEU|nr:hypothetical protein [Crossiella cryophila]MBB4679072.1 hypothetical protein [Crossiella cryophila]
MRWDEQARTAVETALNESDVLGLRIGPSAAWCDLLLHVLALPETGPLDPDARRILRLNAPALVRVLLRESLPDGGFGPALPLADLAAVEEFFAGLTWSGQLYGWRFLDEPSLTADWPAEPSLTVHCGPEPGSRELYWFNECGRADGGYCIEGTVTFEELTVLRADGTPVPLAEFTADGRRYWQALADRDPRLSDTAQQAAQTGTPAWRPYTRISADRG